MSTYLGLHYHLVFGTKHREPSIALDWRSRLHDYLGGILQRLDGFSQGIGGVEDHVHLLVGLKATHRLSDVMRELKKASSVWVHEQIGLSTFAWQEGYAAFTVSPTMRDITKRYIASQEEHHRKRSFRDELIDMLKVAEIDYNAEYLL